MPNGFLYLPTQLFVSIFGAGVSVLLVTSSEEFFPTLIVLGSMMCAYVTAEATKSYRILSGSGELSGLFSGIAALIIPVAAGGILHINWGISAPMLVMLLLVVLINWMSLAAHYVSFSRES